MIRKGRRHNSVSDVMRVLSTSPTAQSLVLFNISPRCPRVSSSLESGRLRPRPPYEETISDCNGANPIKGIITVGLAASLSSGAMGLTTRCGSSTTTSTCTQSKSPGRRARTTCLRHGHPREGWKIDKATADDWLAYITTTGLDYENKLVVDIGDGATAEGSSRTQRGFRW